MHQTINITGTGKVAIAEAEIKDDEVTVKNITIFNDNGKITYYGWKFCKRHEWLLYKAVKNFMYE